MSPCDEALAWVNRKLTKATAKATEYSSLAEGRKYDPYTIWEADFLWRCQLLDLAQKVLTAKNPERIHAMTAILCVSPERDLGEDGPVSELKKEQGTKLLVALSEVSCQDAGNENLHKLSVFLTQALDLAFKIHNTALKKAFVPTA